VSPAGFDVVTGAYGYTGRYIARRLLELGRHVVTLTRRPPVEAPPGLEAEARPLDFADPGRLAAALRGADVLYNTYWVRFSHGTTTFDGAVENTKILVRAAREANVRRIVHLSVTNASRASPLPYFHGKAEIERYIADAGVSYAFIRPTLIFGVEDILVNNIAWLLRRFPFFLVPGTGQYRVQPVCVEDVGRLAVAAWRQTGNLVLDAVGPDVFTFDELVRLIGKKIDRPVRLVHVPPGVAVAAAWLIGRAVGDVLLTRDEVAGLAANLLVSDGPSTATTRFDGWLAPHATQLGQRYASELARHYRSR
jgi:uncharacterized protein YbjT (DUF2867 family)